LDTTINTFHSKLDTIVGGDTVIPLGVNATVTTPTDCDFPVVSRDVFYFPNINTISELKTLFLDYVLAQGWIGGSCSAKEYLPDTVDSIVYGYITVELQGGGVELVQTAVKPSSYAWGDFWVSAIHAGFYEANKPVISHAEQVGGTFTHHYSMCDTEWNRIISALQAGSAWDVSRIPAWRHGRVVFGDYKRIVKYNS
jgi:hypothetical protein